MMSFGLIVLVAFILAILGVHAWCSLSELRDPPRTKRHGGVTSPREVTATTASRYPEI
jgi:hypothetical protein